MNIARVVTRRNWIAWTLIAGGLISLGNVGFDAARATVYQRQYQSALRDATQAQPSFATRAAPPLGDPIGWLEIPRIGLSAAVVHGDTDAILETAIGHLPETPLPWSGGNSALAGHRDTFFRPLRDIRLDDVVRLNTPHGNLEYRVREAFIADPEDVWVLDSTPAATLTLITCYPFHYVGNAPRRFIVRAERFDARHREAQTFGPRHREELVATYVR
jgi:sortase A